MHEGQVLGQGGLNNRKYLDTVTVRKNYWVVTDEGSKFGSIATKRYNNCIFPFDVV